MKLLDLFEADKPKSRREPASMQKLQALMPRFTSALEKYDQGYKIYRGVRGGEESIYIANPSRQERKSKNTINFYTLFIDNDPAWSQYPKRSRSLICSTDYFYASGYGTLYNVLFENHAKIGVCSERDFWESFPNLGQVLKQYGALDPYLDLDRLNGILQDLSEDLLDEPLDTSSYGAIVDQLANITSAARQTLPFRLRGLNPHGVKNALLTAMRQHDLKDILHEMYDPEKNRFELVTVENAEFMKSHEVWGSGLALMVPSSQMPGVMEQYKKYKDRQ